MYHLPGYACNDEHLNMFSVDEGVDDTMEECAIYPDVESMESFQTGDTAPDGSREPICNLEWADDIDVINVLHGEWPVTLQVCYIAPIKNPRLPQQILSVCTNYPNLYCVCILYICVLYMRRKKWGGEQALLLGLIYRHFDISICRR